MSAGEASAQTLAIALVCPTDRVPLQRLSEGALHCPACAHEFQTVDGMVDFLREADPFYEGAFNNEVRFLPRGDGFFHELPLWLITNGYLWAVRGFIPKGATVVELGCAGGVAWLGKRYRTIGVDVSRQGLTLASKKYSLCIRSKTLAPIPDQSVDAVLSSYFWEHVSPVEKDAILSHIIRILRPGGRLIFIYDVTTQNPLIRWLRDRNPTLYQRAFLDADGHIGYQTSSQNEELFLKHGFKIQRSNSLERTPLQSTSVYLKMKNWNAPARQIGIALSVLNWRPLNIAYTALLRLIDETAGRLLPREWGRMTITIAERP